MIVKLIMNQIPLRALPEVSWEHIHHEKNVSKVLFDITFTCSSSFESLDEKHEPSIYQNYAPHRDLLSAMCLKIVEKKTPKVSFTVFKLSWLASFPIVINHSENGVRCQKSLT